MKLVQLIAALVLAATGTAFAAEDHGHETKPLHGGVVVVVKDVEFELGSAEDYVRDMYVFSCWTGGLRISDVLTLNRIHIQGDHLVKKTKKGNSNTFSIKLPKRSKEILLKYMNSCTTRHESIFPPLKIHQKKFVQK